MFERRRAASSESTAAQFATLEFGNVMTGFQANITWLEEVFTAEIARKDVVEALEDIREAQTRLLWLCRESTIVADPDQIDILPVPLDFAPLVSEAIANLAARFGAEPAIEVASIPSTFICADSALMVRLIERMIESALRMTSCGLSTEIRGFIEGEMLHFVAMVVSADGKTDLAESAARDDQNSPLRWIPMRFCHRVARAHRGRLNVRETQSSIVIHLSLPVGGDVDEPEDETSW